MCVFLLTSTAYAVADLPANEEKETELYTYGDVNLPNTKIIPKIIDGINTLILPSTMCAESVPIYFGYDTNTAIIIKGTSDELHTTCGTAVDLTKLCKDGDYRLSVSYPADAYTAYEFRILFSENIPAVYLTSDSPDTKGRPWVEKSHDKSNKATGSMIMQKSNSHIVYNGKLTQIKGRGNTTWDLVKKPYQIKLETKTDLLETGDKKNESKTWVLLANYLDASLVRNSLALNIGKSLGMDDNIESTYIDLYYDGEYRGNYLLAEKVEVSDGRASVTDLEKKNEDANPDIDIENLPIGTAVTKNGATFTYCEGLKSPDDITGGYLLEMDYKVRALEEVCYFYTTRNQYVVVKSPEFASKEEMAYIASLYQEYEDAVYNNGINPTTKKLYSDYIDVESVAAYYLVNEFSKSRDCFKSSAYLHKDADNDKMYMGPLWDYDMSFGTGGDDYKVMDSPYGMIAQESKFNVALMSIDEFYSTVSKLYRNKFYPLIENAISDTSSDSMKSISDLCSLTSASAECDTLMWHPEKNRDEEIKNLIVFITVRKEFLKEFYETFPSLSSMTKDDYFDVLPSQWYYNDITAASRYGLIHGTEKNIFFPEENVTRAQAAQALYNTSGRKITYRNSFSDVPNGKWYTSAVEWLAQNDIYPSRNKQFYPDAEITREEFVTFMYRHQKSPKVKKDLSVSFVDANMISSQSKNAVNWAIENNILEGYNDKIEPKKKMTRAEFATILVRYYEKYLK